MSMELLYHLPSDTRDLVFSQLKEGNFNEVENILKQEYYLKSNPLYLEVLADFYIDTEQYSKVQDTLDQIKRKNKNDPELKPLTARLMYDTMNYDKATQYAKTTLTTQVKNSNAYLSLGNIYLDKAKKEKDRVKKLDFLDESQKNFYYAAKYNPSSAEAHLGMAKIYIEKGRDSNAYDEILVADDMGVYTPGSQYFIGNFFYRIGNYEKAIYALKKPVIYNYYNGAKAHLLLGKIYEKLDDPDNAQKEYQMSARLSHGNSEAAAALKNINGYLSVKEKVAVSKKQMVAESNQQKLIKADNCLIQEKLSNARYLYLQVLETDPVNKKAILSLMELYYSQCTIGYFHPENFFNDNHYFYKEYKDPELQIPKIKLNLISSVRMSSPIKESLNEIKDNSSYEYNALLNSSRAAFLLKDYETSENRFNKLLSMKLSDEQKLNIAKALYLDQNFYDVSKLLKQIHRIHSKSIYDSLNVMVDIKTTKVKEMQAKALTLKKKKFCNEAILELLECNRYYPTYSSSYVDLAELYKKLKKNDEASAALLTYNKLESLYPSDPENVKIYSVKAQKLQKTIDKENEKKKKKLEKEQLEQQQQQ